MKSKKKQLLKKICDKKNIFSILLIVVLGVFIGIEIFDRGTYSTNQDVSDTLKITCPEIATAGESVECLIEANLVTMTVQGINAKYNVTAGMEFVDFSTDTWDIYSNNENGFVLVNLDGVTGALVVGKVRFTIPTTALADEVYKIELVEATVGDGNETVVSLDNVSDNITIITNTNTNTLDNITLSNGSLNESFDKNKYNYTATVDSDKVTVGVVKTDESLVVTGDIGEINLHYGINNLNIVVTGENQLKNTYVISIYRPYTLSTDTYFYNSEEKYIYTGTVTTSETILDNIDVPSELNKEIKDNKLVISYNDNVLEEILILNIDFGNLSINQKVIDLSNNNTYDNFINNFSVTDGISYKILNGTIEVTSGNIVDGGVLKIYYNDIKLDSYNIMSYSLSFDSRLTVDEEQKYIKYLIEETRVSDILSMINLTGGRVVIYDDETQQNVKGYDDVIGSGDVLVIYVNESIKAKYTFSVTGDANGDGVVDLIDLVQIRKHIVGWVNPNTNEVQRKTGVYYHAIDMNQDGLIDLIDLVRMRKTIVGLI